MNFKTLVHLSGITVFIASFIIYYITLEPTTSFWDCGEFILSAHKLEVNHPSGAPLYVLLGRIFTFLSFGNHLRIAWSVNLMSGFFSSLTLFFLFHCIILLVKKISSNSFHIIGSAVIGSLTLGFSDSFWFSAVEAEVYSLSMFFLTVCCWAILKWDARFGEAENNRWLLFISFLTGLGLGVHMINLLVIPSVTIIVFLKSHKISRKNILLSFILGTGLLLAILYALIPGTMWFFSVAETLFVNRLRMPLNSGIIFAVFLLGSLFAYGIHFFQKKRKQKAAMAVFSTALILTGFSVYAVNLIRSQAGPPVNFGEPDNIYSLIDYLNREQYPKRPLLYGQNYNSPVTGLKNRKTKDFDGGKYVERNLTAIYTYAPETCAVFPRMYSSDPGHMEAYKNWVNINGKKVSLPKGTGKTELITIPTLGENISFFLHFQAGHMFWRYFMWNFAGKQNDIQGLGEVTKGNWISGIRFIDALRLGPQNNLPDWMRNNRARNTYFFIPFLLGIIGLVIHFKKDKVSFFSILSLFFLSGIGLVIYINEIPLVPRERDYVYVGAYMAFSIWIGYSFAGIAGLLSRKVLSKSMPGFLFVLLFFGSPVLLLSQNFNDHNRSNRYVTRDFARNILNSCPLDAILFTSGDNDTYPILYCQEVEEIRPDVRVVVMPFVSANWFISQLKMTKNQSEGLKMELPQKTIDEDKLDYVAVLDKMDRSVSFAEALRFIAGEKPGTKLKTRNGDSIGFIPAEELYFSISADGKTGQIPVAFKNREVLYKHELAFWDIVVSNATARPICFVSKAEAQNHGLLNYIRQEGLVYRLVPEKNRINNALENPPVNSDSLYAQLMEEFSWGNIDNMKVNIDHFSVYNAGVFQLQNIFNSLAETLLKEEKPDKARAVLKKSVSLFPVPVFHFNNYSLQQAELLFKTGLTDLGEKHIKNFLLSVQSNLNYFAHLGNSQKKRLKIDILNELYLYHQLLLIIKSYKLEDQYPDAESTFMNFNLLFENML